MRFAICIFFCVIFSGCAVSYETRFSVRQTEYTKPPQVEATLISTY